MAGSAHAAKNETDYWSCQSIEVDEQSEHPVPVEYQMVNQQVYANPGCSQSQNSLSSPSILETILRNGKKTVQGYVHYAENPMIPKNTENVPPICCQYPSCSPTAINGASPNVGYPSCTQEQIQQPPGPPYRYLMNYHGYPIRVTRSSNSSMVPSTMIPIVQNYEQQRYTNVNNNETPRSNRTYEQASTNERGRKRVTYLWMKSSNGL